MFAYLLSSGRGGCYFSRIKLDGTRVSGAAVDSVDYRRKLFLSQVVIWEREKSMGYLFRYSSCGMERVMFFEFLSEWMRFVKKEK